MKKKPNCACVTLSLLAVMILGTLGCQRGETLGIVSGNVTFQGKPVTEGLVTFSAPNRGIYITTPLDSNGHYEVKQAKGTGLQLGEYQASVTPPIADVPMDVMMKGPVKISECPNIPFKYRKASTGGLNFTVVDGENQFDIDMIP